MMKLMDEFITRNRSGTHAAMFGGSATYTLDPPGISAGEITDQPKCCLPKHAVEIPIKELPGASVAGRLYFPAWFSSLVLLRCRTSPPRVTLQTCMGIDSETAR